MRPCDYEILMATSEDGTWTLTDSTAGEDEAHQDPLYILLKEEARANGFYSVEAYLCAEYNLRPTFTH